MKRSFHQISKSAPSTKSESTKSSETKKQKPLVQDIKTRQESKEIIDNYHQLQHRLDQLKREKESYAADSQQEKECLAQIARVKEDMQLRGGIRVYQDACVFDYRYRKDTPHKWIVRKMEEHGMRPEKKSKLKVSLLDVGSLSNFFSSYHWMDVTAIDISPRSPTVKKMDFFKMEVTPEHYSVVVMSLVLNFVGDSKKRGDMLKLAHQHLKPEGFLFLVLPISCINNSKELDHSKFLQIMKTIGFKQFPFEEESCEAVDTSAKLAFYLFQKLAPKMNNSALENTSPKKKLKKKDAKESAVDFGIEL